MMTLVALVALAAEPEAQPLTRLAFAPDARTLAVAGYVAKKPTLEAWDVAGRRRLWRVSLPMPCRGVAWADGKTLLVAAGPAVLVVDAAAGKTARALRAHGEKVLALALTKDGKTLATAGDDKTLLLRDWRADRVAVTCDGDAGEVVALTFSPDGARLLAANGDAAVLWDAATGKRLRQHKPNERHHAAVAFRAGAVITGSWDGVIRVWDGDRVRLRLEGSVSGLAVRGDGLLAAWGHGRSIALYDLDPGQAGAAAARVKGLMEKLDAEGYEAREEASRGLKALGFAAEEALREAVERSASAEVRIRARVLHEALSRRSRSLAGHTGDVRDAAFSPDGKTLASCAEDGTVRLWDVGTGKEVGRLP